MMAQLKMPIGAAKHRMAKEHPDLDTDVLDLPSDALAPFPRTKVKASVQKDTHSSKKSSKDIHEANKDQIDEVNHLDVLPIYFIVTQRPNGWLTG